MIKLDNPKLKGALGIMGKVMLVVSAAGAFMDVLAADSQAKKVAELTKKVAELEKKNS